MRGLGCDPIPCVPEYVLKEEMICGEPEKSTEPLFASPSSLFGVARVIETESTICESMLQPREVSGIHRWEVTPIPNPIISSEPAHWGEDDLHGHTRNTALHIDTVMPIHPLQFSGKPG